MELDGKEVSVFTPSKPREKWLRKRTHVKLRVRVLLGLPPWREVWRGSVWAAIMALKEASVGMAASAHGRDRGSRCTAGVFQWFCPSHVVVKERPKRSVPAGSWP